MPSGAASLEDGWADFHLDRALFLGRAGRADAALAVLDRLAEARALEPEVLSFNRAGLLESAGRAEEAIAVLAEASAAGKARPLLLERLSDLLLRTRQDGEGALARIEEALTALAHDLSRRPGGSSERARLLFKAGRALYLLGRDDEARHRVDSALAICSDPLIQEALVQLRRDLDG
jgi:hypothetical protein